MKVLKGKKRYYLHTIDGHPGRYFSDEQICFCHTRVVFPDDFVRSLKQIRKEQNASMVWRVKQGFTDNRCDYDYILFYV